MNAPSPYADLAPLCGPDHTWLSLFVPVAGGDPASRVAAALDVAGAAGATDALITVARDQLARPVPAGSGGRGVIVSDEGKAHLEHGPEGPGATRAFVGPLPRLAPLLEWRQSVVDHAVVTITPGLVELVTFPAGGDGSISTLGTTIDEAVDRVAESAVVGRELVVLAGAETDVARIRRALVDALPTTTEIRVAEPDLPLSDSVVRHVADVAARRTIGALNEFRFQKTHEAAVEGIEAVVAALGRGDGDLVLVHDDPADERTAWFGPGSSDIALEAGATTPTEGRLVDAVIRMAILQDKAIRVIPSTGSRGPEDDLALVVRDPGVRI